MKTRTAAAANLSGGEFRVLEEGYYYARVESAAQSTREGNDSRFPGQRFTYLKLTPHFHIFAQDQSGKVVPIDPVTVNRQDYTVGSIDRDGVLFRPDGQDDKSPVWGGSGGASDLLKATGFNSIAAFYPELLVGQIVKLRVRPTSYERKLNAEEQDRLDAELDEASNAGADSAALDEIVRRAKVRNKTEIVSVHAVSPGIIELQEWSNEGGHVFDDVEKLGDFINLRIQADQGAFDQPDSGNDTDSL